MLNNALYRQDVNLMHKLHFFIKDLHVQIEQLHSYYKPSLGSRTLTVFRGLTLSMADFNAKIRREKNNLIAFDSFLSTSLSINVAKAFARDKKDPNDQSILLHIEIDADKIGRPFADISRLSEFGKEGEILFSMGTVFRVVDVAEEETSEQLWIVKLVSADDDDKLLMKEGQKTQPMLSSFFKHVYQAQKELGDHRLIAASCVNIASMCFRQRQYKSSLDLYTKSLNTLLQLPSADPLTVATYQSNVARAHLALDETSEALALYEKALETRVKRCERNDPLLINTLHTIGNIYKEKKDYDKAYKVYLRALEFQTSNPTPGLQIDPSSVAATYIYMANVLYEDGHPKAALENFKKALDYQHAHLSKDHPALAFLHNNIGAMHYRNEEYKQALKHHATCLEIEKRSLPKDHITFIDTYRSMAETCERVEKRDEAVEYAQKLVDQCKLHETQAPKQLKEALELLNRLTQDRDLFKP